MDSDDATQACRTEVSRQIVDVRAREIFWISFSTDSEGNAIVLWKTPRNSSGFCRVDRAGRVTHSKFKKSLDNSGMPDKRTSMAHRRKRWIYLAFSFGSYTLYA